MYEAELNKKMGAIENLPANIRGRFLESREQVVARTLLPWGEHCTECNWPTCYTTCELYTPRQDGGCRLFIDGMVRFDQPGTLNGYVLEMRFKRWAKLWTVGNLRLLPVAEASSNERSNIRTGAVVRMLPLPADIKARALRKVSYLRRRAAEEAAPSIETPDWFLFECYNPNNRTINVTFIVRPRSGGMANAFQRMIPAAPGFTREQVPFSEIARRVNAREPFEVEIVPNECDDTVLYFGALDFVKERHAPAVLQPAGHVKTWKCIVWDLDNTLWDGILVEDGLEKLRIRQAVVDVIKETDKRGILHSVASKNNHDDAMKILRMAGIDEYFLHPQIGWQPKSQSVARIIQLLNIGADTVAFVDDQPFEREEVQTALPQVAVIDAAESGGIPGRAECQVPVTEEGRQRRLMYRQQQQRVVALESSGGDYLAFLKDCDIRLHITPLNDRNLDRVYELAQRTNQMNFSGNRYSLPELKELLGRDACDTYVMKCNDKFGSYGVVGFGILDTRAPRLLDLMFSCRIQSKRVEHAFLSFLLNRFVSAGSRDLFANYRPTPKNAASGKVFEEVGFERVEDKEGVLSLVFKRGQSIADDGIVKITEGMED